MIALSTKNKTAASSPLSLAPKEEKSTLSFSELLKGAKGKKDTKDVQNGVVVLALKDAKTATTSEKNVVTSSKQDSPKDKRTQMLESLLKGKNGVGENETVVLENKDVALNPKIALELSAKEIKTLVADAKEYLKDKIMQSDGYKKAQIKELPTTLKGLAKMAKEFGIDVHKITLQEVAPKITSTLAEVDTKEQKSVKEPHAKDEKKSETSSAPQPHAMKKSKKTPVTQESQIAQELSKQKEQTGETAQVQEKVQSVTKELKSMPLFKAQTSEQATTEQLVMLKQLKPQEPTQKERANDTLKLLLRGEDKAKVGTNLTQDFSVATAKVIAPTAHTESQKNLESLLRGDVSKNENNELGLKSDGSSALKADSFEVKINEAKQMTKYLSADVKNAIDEYKSPFTRVKLQLNPQRLGEIDLTIVQRGKNLHVNLTSNNAAINALAMNATDLRTQLQNNGINNATLNFSNTSDNASAQGQTGGQQQHQQQGQRAHEEYNYFASEAENEEILSSLEIIVPRYI